MTLEEYTKRAAFYSGIILTDVEVAEMLADKMLRGHFQKMYYASLEVQAKEA